MSFTAVDCSLYGTIHILSGVFLNAEYIKVKVVRSVSAMRFRVENI